AAERELITSLFDVTTKDALTSVLLVTSAEQEESNSSLVALLEDRAINVTVVKRLEELQSARADAYDAIIGNKVITENCLTNKPSDLDTFVVSTLKALKKGGVLIAREDLSGYSAREKVAQLTHFFDLFRTTVNGVTIGFKFYSLKQINASIHTGGNFLDVFWTLRKEYFEALDENQKTKTFRDFLDTTQYTDESIRAYEWIFGDNFISPGGYDENLEVLKRFGDLKPGCKMLDIGVGIGGGARQAARHWLKPGGKVLITIYGMGHGTLSAKFQAYVEKRKYFLKTLEEMVEITEAAGFENVQGTNLTKRFRDILLDERTKTLNRKNEFLEKFGEETFNSLLNGWNDKIDFIDDDNHNWNQIFATKPL
uniref:phosphoethanolamine N-methyltransferase n=1 Tax=Parascaris univalens TaxID=6257 RepID=A0A914ZM17_PARUN